MDCFPFCWPGAEHERSAGAAAGGEVPDRLIVELIDGFLIDGL